MQNHRFFPSLRTTKKVTRLNASTLQRLFEVLDRLFDPLLEFNSRLPPHDFSCAGDIWLAHLRVVHRQRLVFACRFRSSDSDDFFGNLSNGPFERIDTADW